MSSKSKKIVYASIVIIGGILVYMYINDNKSPVNPVNPVKPVNPVNPVIIHTAPVGHAGLEDFAFSDIKNSYVSGGLTSLSLVPGASSENINGILTNFKGEGDMVLNVGHALTNEMDMGHRDPRAIEGYTMHERHYGAGTPDYRALAGYY